MPDSWRRTTIGEVVTLQRGFDITRSEQRPGEVPVVSSGGVSSWHDHAAAKGPGVVIGRKGTLGRTYYLTTDYWPHDTTLWVRDFKGNDPRFVYYFFSALRVLQLDVGSANPTLNRNHVHPIHTLWPPILEQRRIAGVLGALDDLIDTNRRIAEDCTALWRTVVGAALADAGESVPLAALADFVNGKNFTKDAPGRGRPVIRTPEVRRGPEFGTVRSDVDAADENIVRDGDTLFVWSGSLMVGRWMWEEGLINQHVFKVIPKRAVPAWLVFALIEYQMPWFLSLAADKATTMGHIKREHLDADVPIPSPAEIDRLSPIVAPLWDEALQCGIAIQQLTRIRDELLPLLLAGRVHVNAATESLVG